MIFIWKELYNKMIEDTKFVEIFILLHTSRHERPDNKCPRLVWEKPDSNTAECCFASHPTI